MADGPVLKKNPCPDCNFCQYCSNTRCAVCKSGGCRKTGKPKKISNKNHKPLFRKY